MERTCKKHGLTRHTSRGGKGWRCNRCLSEAVSKRRRKVKATLVAEHGGACVLCGYNACIGALQFHHCDPSLKSFGIAANGFTRSIEASRKEAKKCVLICANCHAEVEAGMRVVNGIDTSR